MLARTQDLLLAAMHAATPYGVLAFNVIGLEHAEAIAQGAEAERAPVILQISQNAIRYRLGMLEPIVAACRQIAEAAAVPVALHLDHATTPELCARAVAAGMSSIMFDASSDSLEENIERTAEIVAWAHVSASAWRAKLGSLAARMGPSLRSKA